MDLSNTPLLAAIRVRFAVARKRRHHLDLIIREKLWQVLLPFLVETVKLHLSITSTPNFLASITRYLNYCLSLGPPR